jgi:hypothetical protein
MSKPRDPDFIFDPRAAGLATGPLVAQTGMQLGVQLATLVFSEVQAEREQARRLRASAAEEEIRDRDLDRLERVATAPGMPGDQQAQAVELMLDLIAARHGYRSSPHDREA